jgi:serine/threonine protein kinase
MGKKYGNWQIIKSLPEGGQAHTHLVKNPDGEFAVLKVIKNPKRAWRYERELKALRQLSSPVIPRLIEFGERDGKPWLILENCGNSLEDKLEEAETITLLCWFKDVALALRDAHANNVIHRDVKPNNVVISPDGSKAALVDFGICRLIELKDSRTIAEALGNAAFAAPECFLGNFDSPEPPCDIYSAGKLLFWMLSRGHYINREQLENVREKIDVNFHPLRNRIFSIISACVKALPDERITADELYARMSRLVEYAQITLYPFRGYAPWA